MLHFSPATNLSVTFENMKQTFPLINEDATQLCEVKVSSPVSCHICDDSTVPIYYYSGKVKSDGEYEYEYEYEYEDVDELCASCISSSKAEPNYPNEWKFTLEQCSDSVTSRSELSISPNLPCFIQGCDAPVCCGKICLFTGIRQEGMENEDILNTYKFWDKGFKDYTQVYELPPESGCPQDVGFFRCKECEQQIFTFQFM